MAANTGARGGGARGGAAARGSSWSWRDVGQAEDDRVARDAGRAARAARARSVGASGAPGRHGAMEYGVAALSPEECEAILAAAPSAPRRNHRNVVEVKARLARGEAVVDGDAVVVREDGAVLFGAEKLHAARETGIPYPTVWVRGVREASLSSASYFAKRTRADFLQSEGVGNAAVVASAFNILDLIGRRGAFNADDLSSAPHESLVHFQETLGDLRDEVGATRAIPASLVPRALGVACLVLISQEDHDRTFAFYADVARAARGEEAHPVSAMLVGALREHLAAERRSREVTVGYLFEAWHHWSRDARPERFGFQGRRAGRGYADWPEIVGVDRIDFPHPPKPPKDLQGADLARLAAHYGEMVASSGVTVEFVPAVDPATGEEWLRRNLRNRNLRPAFVARYRRAMRQGWEVNGKTVKFSADGLMRDGQHRTMAGIEEGVAWPTFVVRGLGPDVFIALDRQGRLSLREILRKDGFHNAQTLASALSALRLFPEADLGGIPLGDLSFEEQRRLIVERHPGLPVSAERYGQKGSFVGVMSPGVVVALHYLAAKEDRRAADAFFDQLRLDLGKGDPRHNAQILRGILTRLALSRARHPSPAKQAELIRMAYERTLSGGRLTKQEVQEALKG